MTAYLLRAIDPALWRAFQARAAMSGQTARSVLLMLVAGYVDGTVTISAGTPRKKGTR